MVKIHCECCGEPFAVKPSKVERTRFCSRDCRSGGVERIRSLYAQGLSSTDVAVIVGRSEVSVRRTAKVHGFGRDRSEAMAHRWATATPEARQAMLEPAHDAVRGTTHTLAKRIAHADMVANVDCFVGPHEVTFAGMLDERGIAYDQQTPCGPYNIDFTLAELGVAVEIVAGGGNDRVRADRRNRCEQVLNEWHLIEVRFQTPLPRKISPLVVDEIVAFGELVAGLPAFPGKHRMVRTDGQVIRPRSTFNRYLASRA